MPSKQRFYYVYILSSLSGTLYTGITNSLYRRTLQHKGKETPGFTSKYDVDRLVYYEVFHDVRAAIRREKEIKGWLRKKKIALIEKMNPKWQDLAEGLERRCRLPRGPSRIHSRASILGILQAQ